MLNPADHAMELHLPAARSIPAAFGEGLSTPWLGLRYMSRHPALWRYGVIPVLLNLVITTLLLVVLIAVAILFFREIHPWFGDRWGWILAEIVCGLLLLVAVLGLVLVAWLVLQGILCGHFYSKLARQVELQLGMPPDDIEEVPFAYQVADTLRDVGFLAVVNLACVCVQIVPVIGSVLGVCGGYYFNCFTFGLDYLDHPLALRGIRRREKRAFAKRHRAHTLGLGTAVLAITLLPVVNAVLLTTAVTGAVLLHRRLSARDERRAGRGPGDRTTAD
ncbi:MAG: EI24 domain-containing protein [Planctomycetota bacterium]|jgi:CysZ protein